MSTFKCFFEKLFSYKCSETVWYFLSAFIILFFQTDNFFCSLSNLTRVIQFLILGLWAVIALIRYWVKTNNTIIYFVKYRFELRVLLIPLLLITLSFVVNITNLFNVHRYLITIANLLLCFVIVCTMDVQKLFKHLVILLLFFSVISVFFFLIDYIKPNFFNFLPRVINQANNPFNVYFLGVIRNHNELGISTRNYSFFREPGVFAAVIVFFMIIMSNKNYRFKNKILNYISFIVLSITLFTTFSTTAIIAFVFVLLYLVINNFNYKKPAFYILLSLIVSIVLFVIIFAYTQPDLIRSNSFLYAIFGKFIVKSNSYQSRLFDSVFSIVSVLHNPITGNGWGNHSAILNEFSYAYKASTNGGINSFITIASVYGVFFFYVMFKYWVKGLYKISNNKIVGTIFATISIILVFSSEDLTNNIIMFIIPYIAFCNSKSQELVISGENINEEE